MPTEPTETRWLLLIHQIPRKPDYLRVKIGRHLQRLGAVAIKNSVYVLPCSDQAHEDFQWVAREIVEGKGDATICEARFLEGLSGEQVEGLFNSAREPDYVEIAQDARRLLGAVKGRKKLADERRAEIETAIARLRRRLAEIVAIDFFAASGGQAAEAMLGSLERELRKSASNLARTSSAFPSPKELRAKTWVTRKGIHVDRIASAWLIRRFIDTEARFKFVPGRGYRPEPGEMRFDMFEAEYTHEGDRCTFEVLLQQFDLTDPALEPIAEIVHDIDLKDSKFGRAEAPGIDRLVAGIAMANEQDDGRLAHGSAVFDGLYEYFKRKRLRS